MLRAYFAFNQPSGFRLDYQFVFSADACAVALAVNSLDNDTAGKEAWQTFGSALSWLVVASSLFCA
jgi:hypothetical protein